MAVRESHQDDKAHRLIQLLDACHRVLPHLGDREDKLAQAIRKTCNDVQGRLTELGVPYMETGDQPSTYVVETRPG